MAATSVVKISGYVTDDLQTGSRAINVPDYTNLVAPGAYSVTVELGSGDNTIAPPNISTSSVARGVIIIFDPTSTTTKKLKGNAGDTGVILRKNGMNFLSFDDAPPAGFIINSSAADTDKATQIIFT